MAMISRSAAATNDLTTLQQIVRDFEPLLGALVAIGPTDAGENLLVFHPDEIPDDDNLSVLAIVDGHPPLKPGNTLVCFGSTFVSSAIKMVAAYRKT